MSEELRDEVQTLRSQLESSPEVDIEQDNTGGETWSFANGDGSKTIVSITTVAAVDGIDGAEMEALQCAIADLLGIAPELVYVGESDNGDDDWTYPVYAEVSTAPDAYALCDLAASTIEDQAAFMVGQLREGMEENA